MMKTRWKWFLFFGALLIVLAPLSIAENVVHLEFFYSDGCPDCAQVEPVIDEIEDEYGAHLWVERLEVGSIENWDRFHAYEFLEVPAVVLNNQTKYTFTQITKENLSTSIDTYLEGTTPNASTNQSFWIVQTPFGEVNLSAFSLPILTIVLGGLDSINPCSFWVLVFLLSLLLYVQSRRRMLLIGGIFIFFSGFIYFLFMVFLLGIFLLTSQLTWIAIFAGVVALFLGGINIKDFFFFKQGLSLSIPESKKPSLFKKMRDVVNAAYLPSMIAGTILLAIFANTYELFCTMGFPLVYTKILTLYTLSPAQYYLYVVLYNVVYIIPLLVIVLVFTITLGRRKMTEWQGRILKLFSGLMMLLLGVLLVFQPQLLTNVFSVILIPVIAVIVTSVIVVLSRLYRKKTMKEPQ
ncbi:MAG: hypothetical protein V1726_02565 [Methanobacteriota archaeon]